MAAGALLWGASLGVGGADPPFTVVFGEVLSSFGGPVRVGEARVAIDASNREVLVGEARSIYVFDAGGMKVHGFEIASNLGAITGLAVLDDGAIVALAYDQNAPGDRPRPVLALHDYRGAPIGEIELKGIPEEFKRILPNRLERWGDRLVLVSTLQLVAVEVGTDGTFQRGWDLAALLEIPPEDVGSVELTGFAVDGGGNLLLTSAVLFRAFLVHRDGSVTSWGSPGSNPGSFGNAAGITTNGHGLYFVADKLRKVILVFDSDFQFLFEFGGEPSSPRRLGRPSDVVSDGGDRLYVTQVGKAGVWAYDVRRPTQ